MAEEYRGYRFSTPEEDGEPPLTQKEIDETMAAVAEFEARRAAVRPEDRVDIGDGDRFGGWDGWAGEKDEDYLRRREAQEKGDAANE
jgi:hypothetical protein